MFKHCARVLAFGGLSFSASLFAGQAAQAQNISINIGGSGNYGGGYGYGGGGYGGGYGYYPPINNGVYQTYGGYGYNPYPTGYRNSTYFPTNNYRSNMSPYIRHYVR